MWRQVVAQSPGLNAPTQDVVRYDVGWKALNTMLKSGRSLSGHERNCCFLNTRGGRFADISAAADIDFDDDGRVLATVDWDFDGDLDFWIANRTGPQVRFLRNDHENQHNFVAFKLEGTTCNRDAIGARVELYLKNDDHPKRARTLRAGEGYLAQCSKWVHFGLGEAKDIQKVIVRWPDGTQDVYPEVIANNRYRIKQGFERPLNWNAPTRNVHLTAKKVVVPESTDKSRIVLIAPVPIPAMQYATADNQSKAVAESNGRARLINLWATWCKPCLHELAEWVQHQDALRAAGVDILTINVDEPTEDRAAQLAKIEQMTKAMQLPFATGYGTKDLVSQFDVLQRSIIRRQRPLPVPSSFLIDGRGNLRIIYKGPVSSEQLVADSKLLDASPEQIVDASVPYKGIWLGRPAGTSPNQLAVRFIEGGFLKETEQYIRQLAANGTDNPMYSPGDAQVLLGAILLDQGRLEEAAEAFQLAIKYDPHHRQSHIELAGILVNLKRPKEATVHYAKALERRPNDPELLFKLGMAHSQAGEPDDAIQQLRKSIVLRPNVLAHHQIANILIGTKRIETAVAELELAQAVDATFAPSGNNLAWILATNPKDALRNGARALEVAEQLCSGSNRTAGNLDTLGAAYAEVGEFAKAIEAAEESIRVATQAGDQEKTARVQARLELYLAGKPYRDQ